METYYTSYEYIRVSQRLAEEKAVKFAMIKLAEQGNARNSMTKMLVKLSGILIDAGMRLKNYTEKDLKNNLQIQSLQDL